MVCTLPRFVLRPLQETAPWSRLANDYYGAYNTVLFHVFPPEDDYQISPQYYDLPGQSNPARKTGIFDFRVKYYQLPFFFIKISPRPHIETQTERAASDHQMRMIMADIVDLSIMPMAYGISFLGTLFSIYQYNRATKELTPPAILDDATHLVDTAPREMWQYDLLTPAGVEKFMEIVGLARSMAESEDVPEVAAHVAKIKAKHREWEQERAREMASLREREELDTMLTEPGVEDGSQSTDSDSESS